MPVAKPKIAEVEVKKGNGKGQMSVPKPKIAELEVKKGNGKGQVPVAKPKSAELEVKKGNAKGQVLVPKPKSAEVEVRKDSGKGKVDSAKSGDDPRAATKPRRQAADAPPRDRAAARNYSVSASHFSRYAPALTAR